MLGDEDTSAAVKQVYGEYAKKINPRTWEVFINGTPEEQTAFHEDSEREVLSKSASGVNHV